MKVFIGSDHAGFGLKSYLIEYLKQKFPVIQIQDCGCASSERTDYTQYGHIVAQEIIKNDALGILICGTGIGVSIAANRHKGIRAAVIYNNAVAELSRQHNNANIACFGARMLSREEICQMAEIFLNTDFTGGIHSERIRNIENC